MKIAIIGAGNLGLSIARGLVNSHFIEYKDLVLSKKTNNHLEELQNEGFNVVLNSKEASQSKDIVIIAVKPWQIDDLLSEIAPSIEEKSTVLVSCVTGASSKQIYEKLGKKPALFLAMPNTGVSVSQSMTCLAPSNETAEQKDKIAQMFGLLGEVLFVKEDLLPQATAIAGCGIAYALRFIRATSEAGVEIGFNAKDSSILAAQIMKGAAELILKNHSHPEVEIDKVTTPKGITIAALNEMEHNGFSSSIIKGILTAYNKASK